MTSTRDWAVRDRRSVEKRLAVRAFELEADWATVAARAAEEGDRFRLPGIWITPPALNELGEIEGRTYAGFYDAEEHDPGGEEALYWGSCYYREAMEHQDAAEHEVRVDCFKAAEVLYLHAAKRGNVIAFVNLGYVYSYDRCENDYWEQKVLWMSDEDVKRASALRKSFSREQHAYECYLKAAEAGDPEACYKVGDLIRDGRGCEQDEVAAFGWFERAFELGRTDQDVCWGSAALRLATCCEEGRGCEQDFARAREWYEVAVAGLRAAVNSGNWYYEKSLTHAEHGLARVRQELSGAC